MTSTLENTTNLVSTLTERPKAIQAKLDAYEKRYRNYSWNYLFFYRCLLVSSALLSASAAIVINLNMIPENSRKDSASILAALATVSTTLIGTIGLESNWRSNRQARDRVRALQLELLHEQPQYDRIIDDLQKVIEDRVSQKDNSSSPPPTS